MANRNMRSTTTKVEALIESCRSEGKWQRVIDLTDELKTGSPQNECLANFLVGEARLESYLEENALVAESNFGRAKTGLSEARRYLNLALGECGQKAGIALDAYLLLAKLCFACGEFEPSLDNFIKAELNTLAEKELTLRSLKILAESYAIKGLGASKKLWKPRKYQARQQFSPRNQQEEVILLLLIAEALAVRDTVLSQSPEFKQARQHAMGNVTAVYDLLTLATVRWGLVQLLNESFEKALKFSFGEQHVWRQYGLSLMAAEKHSHALRVLQESIKLTPSDPLPCLLASRLCYESLETVKQGLDYAQQALKREIKGLRPSRSQLFVGIGQQQLAIQSNLRSDRDACHKLALEALERAVQNDGHDHLAEYYLSLQYALLNQLPEALAHIRFALALRMEHAPCLHLFALLLTASRRPREALGVVEDALHEFPDNLQLLHVKAHLQLHLEDAETALATVQHMLAVWREVFEAQLTGEEEKHSDTKSGVHLVHSSQMSDKDSNSVYAASLAAVSRVEHAVSEAASSLSSFTQRPGPRRPWMLQIEIWLLLADVYLRIDQPNEALNCIHEASQIYPLSHQIMYMRGQVHVYLEQWRDAKQCYLNAVAANPNHTEALRALGETHLILGEPRLAEKMLKDAAKLDPNCPRIWFALGKVMESLGDFYAAADCFATSLQLEPSCPVLPFTSIPLVFE
ncbi:tetratricopeptide repeat protein 7B isoform X3 [Drosophila miranda]|uniref:tetratricopeptide repeat protein 7B isoform X3 n=1 Tax=Drosophila miranda TaxID=7229 RepID=UPI0007E7841B|nr:tetratricopeptide repeat protein 7B isoform X3 [Drosophila miranda]